MKLHAANKHRQTSEQQNNVTIVSVSFLFPLFIFLRLQNKKNSNLRHKPLRGLRFLSLISEKIVKKFSSKVKRTYKNPISVHSTVLSFGEKPVLRTREYTIFRRTIGGKPTFSGLFTSHLILSFHLCYFLSLICDTFDSPVLHYGTNQSRLLLFLCHRQLFPGVRRQTRTIIFWHNFTAKKNRLLQSNRFNIYNVYFHSCGVYFYSSSASETVSAVTSPATSRSPSFIASP